MAIELLNLPTNILDGISHFVDYTTLIQLRLVSNSMKKIADFSIVRTVQTVVDIFYVANGDSDNQTKLKLSFSPINLWNFLVAKSCFQYAADELDVIVEDEMSMAQIVVMSSLQLRRFLDRMKRLIRRADIRSVRLNNHNPEPLSLCAEFLEGKRIGMVHIGRSEIIDYAPFLELMRRVNTGEVELSILLLNKAAVEFMLELADFVKSIWIFYELACINAPHPNIVSIIRQVLSRKCEILDFNEHCPNANLSIADAENLIKFLHHKGKKLSLTSWRAHVAPINFQIGVFKVRADGYFMLKHLDMW